MLAWFALLSLASRGPTAAAAVDADSWRRAAATAEGLCVVVPGADPDLTVDLSGDGRRLVHALCLAWSDVEAVRRAAAVRGRSGFVTAELLGAQGRLPFSARSVNLLLVDLDALGPRRIGADELRRVVVPDGTLITIENGQSRTARIPWPEQLDDWTHFSYGPEANAVSRDALPGLPTSLRWVAGVRAQDVRVARGVLVAPLVRQLAWHSKETGELRGRDAFNGLLRWTTPTGLGQSDRPNEWAVGAGLVFHFPHHQPCHAVATDLATGRPLRQFDEGVVRPNPEELGKQRAVAFQLVCGGALIQSYRRNVVALEIATGRRLWHYDADDNVGFLSATPDGARVFLHETHEPERGRARWGKHTTARITALRNGRVLWKTERLRGQEVSDLVYHDGAVYVFDPVTNLGDDGDANLWKLSADDGRILWASERLQGNYNISLNSVLVRDDRVYSWGPFNNLRCYGVDDGREQDLSINSYNQRCTRLSATGKWLIFGLSSWVARDGTWAQLSVARSDCSLPAYPAHGQVYFGSNVTCTCINPLRGIVALDAEPPGEPLPEEQRLERLDGAAAPVSLGQPPESLLATEWRPDPLVFYYLANTTTPVPHGPLTLVADVHRHCLRATRGEQVVWSFLAGGRIYGEPLILGDRCYVASADGFVSCLDAATGKPQWRFLAAPRRRNVIVHGQIESAWPVYNVVEHKGCVCVAAGRHMELDGGLYLWGLDPTSGAVRWRTRLFAPPRVLPPGEKSPRDDRAFRLEVAQRGALNGGLSVADGKLFLRSPYFDKRGSSPSATGYFAVPGGVDRRFTFRPIAIDPATDDGKTIDPRELVELPAKR